MLWLLGLLVATRRASGPAPVQGPMVGSYMDRLELRGRALLQYISEQGRDPIEGLLGYLHGPDEPMRGTAAQVLGELNEMVRESPLRATVIQELGNAMFAESLMEGYFDRRSELRSFAAEALGRIGDASAAADLGKALSHPNTGVRRNAAWALGRIASPDSVEALAGALGDSVGDVRDSARNALTIIGTPEALSAIQADRLKRQSRD
jgi:HEAT repeat protein